jgi:cardiolipin synthase
MIVTLPNFLTLLRILAVPFFAMAVWDGRMEQACLLFAGAGLTDLLDGYLARRFNQKSALGAILDPAADKLLMTTAFILMAFPREAVSIRIPAWVAILAISRDLVISLVTLIAYDRWDHSKFVPSYLGKFTTMFELLAISMGLLFNTIGPYGWYRFIMPWAFYVMAGLVVASSVHYFYRMTTGPEARTS